MPRETHIVTTPKGGHKVELYSFITGRDRRTIREAFMDGSVRFNAEKDSVEGLNPLLISKAQDAAWQRIIVSIDGKKDGVDGFSVVDAILDMHVEDHDFVVNAVNEITEDKRFEEKKTR